MEITPRIDGVTGSFDTDTGRLVCVSMPKHAEVMLCFAEGMNIPFASIKLHSEDLFKDAMAVLDDATLLGEEIARRWNDHLEVKQHQQVSPGTTGAESAALQECAALLGLDVGASPAAIIDTLRNRMGG